MSAEDRRRRGVVADALLGAGATLLLLQATLERSAWRITLGALLVLAGATLLWGVPRPTLRLRMLSSIAGLLLGFGLATAGSGVGSFVAFLSGLALLLGCLRVAGGARVVRRRR